MRPLRGLTLAIIFSLSGCWTASYLAQQGVGELRLLHARRRISDVLADRTVDADTKQRLQLALAARSFGVEVLGLRGGDAYTRFLDTRGQPVAWNLSAAPKDKLEAHRHVFPITGAVPYLGYFREADARAEEARLQAAGYDTFVRAVSGFSTLGVTSDPIYSSMLEGPPSRIVEVVLHEMLHGTIYVAGQSEWDESLATFVGLHGAALFFAMQQGGGDTAQKILDDAQKRADRDREFSEFLQPVVGELRALYAEPIPREEKIKRREEVFARARAEYFRRFPKGGAFAAQPLNNAVVLAFAVYHEWMPEHERLYRVAGRDLVSFIKMYKRAVENQRDPIGWLKKKK